MICFGLGIAVIPGNMGLMGLMGHMAFHGADGADGTHAFFHGSHGFLVLRRAEQAETEVGGVAEGQGADRGRELTSGAVMAQVPEGG